MTIQNSLREILKQLEESLVALTDVQYSTEIDLLSGATIGQHVRHTLEMLVCLQDGYLTGRVNYENRRRDREMETLVGVALGKIRQMSSSFYEENRDLFLEGSFDANSDALNACPTNYMRELAYNLEHFIHHMALIRIGFREISGIKLPEAYGVAPSTIKYRHSEGAFR